MVCWREIVQSLSGGAAKLFGARTWRLRFFTLFGLCLSVHFTVCIGDSLATCIDCHDGIESIADGEMAVQIHRLGERYGDPAGCVVCHGGNPGAVDGGDAHQGAPSRLTEAGGPGSFYPDPGQNRSAGRTCGQCHEGYAERWRKSVMSTEAETIGRDLCAPAWQKKATRRGGSRVFGRYGIADEDGPEPIAGSPPYKSLMRSLIAERPEDFPRYLHEVPAGTLGETGNDVPASCKSCHGDAARSRRHPGCSSCHVPRGTYQGRDRTIDRTKPGNLLVHRIQGGASTTVVVPGAPEHARTGIPLESCFQCHFDPRLASVNEMGDAFVHYGSRHDGSGRGLLCQDCHTSIEMHGDGNIAAVNAAQSEVRCEDCHGTTEQLPWELPLGYQGPEDTGTIGMLPRGTADNADSLPEKIYPAKDGYLLTSRGNPFGNVIREGDQVLLYSASGETHQVTLLKYLMERNSWRSELSKQVKCQAGGHKDMACRDCHADWLPTCSGCHAETGAVPDSHGD